MIFARSGEHPGSLTRRDLQRLCERQGIWGTDKLSGSPTTKAPADEVADCLRRCEGYPGGRKDQRHATGLLLANAIPPPKRSRSDSPIGGSAAEDA